MPDNAFTGPQYRHPSRTSYTHEELAEDLKNTGGAAFVVDDKPVPATQDGSLPTAQVEPGDTPAFVYTEGWDKGFAGEGDPYGITAYTDQSANPDAAKLPAPEKSDDEKKAALIDQDLHPEKYEEPSNG